MRKHCDRCIPTKKASFHVKAGHSFCLKHLKEYSYNMSREGKLTERTIAIIKKNGKIVLKRADGFYLSCWTNIAAGPDNADWSGKKNALEIFSLLWAFTIAPLYKTKVTVIYPKGK
jgi:hypothetical protein